MIVSAGYRIGPEEVEETLLKHEAVAETVVVGEPHEGRGQIVKAYVELPVGTEGGEALADEIADFAASELSKHEYPPSRGVRRRTAAHRDRQGRPAPTRELLRPLGGRRPSGGSGPRWHRLVPGSFRAGVDRTMIQSVGKRL